MTILRIPVNVGETKPLREDMLLSFDPDKQTVGKVCGKLSFKKEADVLISTGHTPNLLKEELKYVTPDRIVMDFFGWDYNFERLKYPPAYKEYMKNVAAMGIDKCVGIDFSTWWDMEEPYLLYHTCMNYDYLRMAQDAGFKGMVNWSCVQMRLIELSHHVLPSHIPTMFFDKNHTLNNTEIGFHVEALTELLKSHTIGSFIFQASTRTLEDIYPFILELKKNNIKYAAIPSQTTLLNGVQTKNRKAKSKVGNAQPTPPTGGDAA